MFELQLQVCRTALGSRLLITTTYRMHTTILHGHCISIKTYMWQSSFAIMISSMGPCLSGSGSSDACYQLHLLIAQLRRELEMV